MKRKDLKKLIIEVKDEINKECVAATQNGIQM